MTTRRIRLMCVDDHRIIIEGVAAMLRREPDMELVAAAPSGKEAIELHRQHRPDVVLMDLNLPGTIGGIEAIQAIRREDAEARVIVLTILQGGEDVHRALDAGATTYLLKDALTQDLIRVIRQVHGGAKPLPANVAAALESRDTHRVLTRREIEVLDLLARGMRNKEISATLGVSADTTKLHVKNILAKLNVSGRTAAVTLGLRRGIIHLSSKSIQS